jgi:type IV secretion system protein VirD4
VVFTPKELKVAQDLSERLGYYTYEGRSKSRPTFVGSGKWTTTASEQRRALMLPQELLQMSRDALIVLRGGIPPVKARKIFYFANPDFTKRVQPPPTVPSAAAASPQPAGAHDRLDAMAADLADLTRTVGEIHAWIIQRPLTEAEAAGEAELNMEAILLELDSVDLEDLPPGATEKQSEEWIDRYINSGLLLETEAIER